MSALPVQTIFDVLHDAGLSLSLMPDGGLAVAPASRITKELRDLIRSNKPALVDLLLEAKELTARLIAAAMRRCDQFNDSEAARQAMRDDCLGTPPHLQADLLDYFQDEGRPGLDRVLAKYQAQAATEKARKQADPEPRASPSAWRELAREYHAHHFGCPACIAGGQGRGLRCGVGSALWISYQSTN